MKLYFITPGFCIQVVSRWIITHHFLREVRIIFSCTHQYTLNFISHFNLQSLCFIRSFCNSSQSAPICITLSNSAPPAVSLSYSFFSRLFNNLWSSTSSSTEHKVEFHTLCENCLFFLLCFLSFDQRVHVRTSPHVSKRLIFLQDSIRNLVEYLFEIKVGYIRRVSLIHTPVDSFKGLQRKWLSLAHVLWSLSQELKLTSTTVISKLSLSTFGIQLLGLSMPLSERSEVFWTFGQLGEFVKFILALLLSLSCCSTVLSGKWHNANKVLQSHSCVDSHLFQWRTLG